MSRSRTWTVLLVLSLLTLQALSNSPPVVIRNLARGSALKCLADLSGGLPFEVWKSNVVLEHIRANHDNTKPASDVSVLRTILQKRGVQGMWSGCPARMIEGFFSGAVLLAAKETMRKTMTASPLIRQKLSPAVIGFVAGASGGAAQAIVMAPCSMLVTATAANGGSVMATAADVWSRKGLRGIYRGSSAVAARQATNWASRQGFTEFMRPRISIAGVPGELVAGFIAGAFSCWNTPFEIARIEAQSNSFSEVHEKRNGVDNQHQSLLDTMNDIVKKRGVGGLYIGIGPRVFQSCYQTVFLVCIPRVLDA